MLLYFKWDIVKFMIVSFDRLLAIGMELNRFITSSGVVEIEINKRR